MTEGEHAAALAVLLGHMVAYLSGKVDVNELDIMSFSLHHLFCNFDSLYCVLLPSFAGSLAAESGEATEAHVEQLQPRTWMQLQAVRQAARRMLPLCQLLSEAGESILGQLAYGRGVQGNQDILYEAVSAGVEQALHDLAATLMCWQRGYSDLSSFRSLLYTLFPTVPLPLQPDTPFTQLLTYACTLFGDILPAFHALAPGDEEAVLMLLFDLLQQVDLLAIACETLLQLFAVLLQYSMKTLTGMSS